MDIREENIPITKHQRYYRKNKERRKREARLWQLNNPVKEYVRKRKYFLKQSREYNLKKLKELKNVE